MVEIDTPPAPPRKKKAKSHGPAQPALLRQVGRRGKHRPKPIRRGRSLPNWRDIYHLFLRLPTALFVLLICGAYLLGNAAFALIYLTDPGGIVNARPGVFSDAFFFSVETMSTIGYGVMSPGDLFTNCVMTTEALTGLLSFALAAGIIFSRFSRPTARVMFSEYAVVMPYEGFPTLMFRTANERANQILEANIRVTLARNEVSIDGARMRRQRDLTLVRSQSSIFSISWTVMHVIDELSPLYEATPQSLKDNNTELVVVLDGIDETYSQPIYARHSFVAEEIKWNERLVDIISLDERGRFIVDYRRFHETEKLPE